MTFYKDDYDSLRCMSSSNPTYSTRSPSTNLQASSKGEIHLSTTNSLIATDFATPTPVSVPTDRNLPENAIWNNAVQVAVANM